MSEALPVTERPFRHDPVSTGDLPATPTRDHRIPATAWREAPDELLALRGDGDPAYFLRRIHAFLLWRAGPPVGEAIYLAIDESDLTRQYRFDLHGRTGEGLGPDGRTHERFRTWKEALRDA
jgi:hypothetical protein